MGLDQTLDRIPKLNRNQILIDWDYYEYFKKIIIDAIEVAYFRKFYDLDNIFREELSYEYSDSVAVIVSKEVLQKCCDFLNKKIEENNWFDEEEKEQYIKAFEDITKIIIETDFNTQTILYHSM